MCLPQQLKFKRAIFVHVHTERSVVSDYNNTNGQAPLRQRAAPFLKSTAQAQVAVVHMAVVHMLVAAVLSCRTPLRTYTTTKLGVACLTTQCVGCLTATVQYSTGSKSHGCSSWTSTVCMPLALWQWPSLGPSSACGSK